MNRRDVSFLEGISLPGGWKRSSSAMKLAWKICSGLQKGGSFLGVGSEDPYPENSRVAFLGGGSTAGGDKDLGT